MSRVIAGSDHSFIEKYQEMQNTMAGKLIFTKVRGSFCGLLYADNRLRAVQVLSKKSSKVGAVYVGKVKNVVKNIDACFVEISNKELCFLPLKEATDTHIMNRTADGRILEGDEILVQVSRDAQKTKQASVTAKVNLSAEELEKAAYRVCFSCVKEAPPAFLAVLEDMVKSEEYDEIVTDDPDFYELLKKYLEEQGIVSDDKAKENETPVIRKKLRLYEDKTFSLSKLYALESKMDTALDKRVWLNNGGYLVIEPTEAMTVIDVNSGKFDAKKSTRETIFKINCEAALEIALQLRLRNLSGIILVDFINMKEKEDQKALLDYLKMLVGSDILKTVVVDMTPLGLVEITRKKKLKTLREQFAVEK